MTLPVTASSCFCQNNLFPYYLTLTSWKRKQMCACVHINTHTLRKWIRMSGHIWQNQKSTFHINLPWKQIWKDSEAQHYYEISSVSFGEHYMRFKTISEILMVQISCWETWSQRVKSPVSACLSAHHSQFRIPYNIVFGLPLPIQITVGIDNVHTVPTTTVFTWLFFFFINFYERPQGQKVSGSEIPICIFFASRRLFVKQHILCNLSHLVILSYQQIKWN